jgi:hypothetical protein
MTRTTTTRTTTKKTTTKTKPVKKSAAKSAKTAGTPVNASMTKIVDPKTVVALLKIRYYHTPGDRRICLLHHIHEMRHHVSQHTTSVKVFDCKTGVTNEEIVSGFDDPREEAHRQDSEKRMAGDDIVRTEAELKLISLEEGWASSLAELRGNKPIHEYTYEWCPSVFADYLHPHQINEWITSEMEKFKASGLESRNLLIDASKHC